MNCDDAPLGDQAEVFDGLPKPFGKNIHGCRAESEPSRDSVLEIGGHFLKLLYSNHG